MVVKKANDRGNKEDIKTEREEDKRERVRARGRTLPSIKIRARGENVFINSLVWRSWITLIHNY